MLNHEENLKSLLQNKAVIVENRLQQVCEYLKNNFPHYDWVGFYFADHASQMLHLGPFAGEPTEHTAIPFGKGICGQVAVSNQNFIVPDVAAQDNYIACSLHVKAEIVVPIFKEGKNIGQIDIDSHTPNPFTSVDLELLEFTNRLVAEIL